jgi:hypothetical protein
LALLRGDPALGLAELYRELQTRGVLPPSRAEFHRLQQEVKEELRLLHRALGSRQGAANRARATIAANDAAWDVGTRLDGTQSLLRRSTAPADKCNSCGRPMGGDGYCCVRGGRADDRH